MNANLRQIRHPGPVSALRHVAVPCRAVALKLHLRAGQSLAQAVPKAFAQAGYAYGYLRLDGVAFAQLHCVTPAPAPGDGHAAWYSAPHQSAGAVRMRHGGVHLGQREGAPFLHCHGLWEGAGDAPDAGHLLCDNCLLATDCTVAGWGLHGAGLTSCHDPETGFTLFTPQLLGPVDAADALLLTLKPNQDLAGALLALAREHGINAAQVEGIGSLVGTDFADGTVIESYATEFLLLNGRVAADMAELCLASVGFDGEGHTGPLMSGRNAICVTAELLLLAH